MLSLTYLTSYTERLLINTLDQGHKGGFVGSPKIKYNVITRRIGIERSGLLDTRARIFREKRVNYGVEQPRFIAYSDPKHPVRSEPSKIFQIPSTTEIARILEIANRKYPSVYGKNRKRALSIARRASGTDPETVV